MNAVILALAAAAAVLLPAGPVWAQFDMRPDTLRLDVSLAADSAGVFDTLRQSALFCRVSGGIWPDSAGEPLYIADDPQIPYRWTLISRTTADTVFDSVTALYAPEHTRLRLFPLEDGDYTLFATIPDTDYHRITVYPDSIPFTVHTTRVPVAGNRWQMVSLARQVPDPAAAVLFAGQNFWCYHWHESPGGDEGNYVNYVSRSFAPGYGYWVRVEGAAGVLLNTAGSSVDSTGEVSLPLLEGWNQVANPFGYTVAWDSAYFRTASNAKMKIGPSVSDDKPRGLFAWDASAGSYVLLEPGDDRTVSLMEPWQGYWVYADRAVTIHIPPSPYFSMVHPAAVPAGAKTAERRAADGWRISLAATQGAAVDRCCVLGTAPGAAAGYGPEDIRKPAPMDPPVRLDLADGLARDIRPDTGTQVWNVALRAACGGPVTLSWDTGSVPAGCALYLYDGGSGATVDMKRTSSHTVPRTAAAITVVASDDPAFNPAAAGDRLAVTGTGSLPFTGSAELVFTVPFAAMAKPPALTVFGADGSRIAVRSGAAGAGRIGWDGCDDAGNAVPGGAYVYVISVGTARAAGLFLKAE